MADVRKLREAAGAQRSGGYLDKGDTIFIVALVNAFDNGDLIPREEVDALRAENERLRTSLRPFSEEALAWSNFENGEMLVEPWVNSPQSGLCVAHLRDARAALNPEGEE